MVDTGTIVIIFVVLGAILIMAEAAIPGIYIIIPGTVLMIMGIAGHIYPGVLTGIYAPILAAAVALPATVGTVYLYRFLGTPDDMPTTRITEHLVGMDGIVTVKTVPGSIKGKVRINSEIWSAKSSEPIEPGTEVTVIRADGIHVTVSRKHENKKECEC